MRRPVAAKTAFDTAAAVTAVPGSPIPPGASRLRTRCTSIAGASLIRTTRTSWKLDCSTRPFLSVTPPHSAPPIPKMIPPSICAFTVSGLTTTPQSTAIGDRILLRGRGELVHEALDHEVVVCHADASPEPGVDDRLLVAHVFHAERGDV